VFGVNTLIEAAEALVLQEYVTPPLAVSNWFVALQVKIAEDGDIAAMGGAMSKVTFTVEAAVQPLEVFVAVTV